MPDNTFAIETEDLTRDFATVRAVDGLSLEVPAGAIFGFLGPNGSGKTTTIRLLLGLLSPTRGRARVLGFDTRRDSDRIRAACGALLEHPGLYEHLSADDNLEFFGRVWRMKASERRERIRELLVHLGLWDRRGERVGDWSRGMKQKLAVARALLHRPSLLFLDEPTNGLDPIAAAELRDDLRSLAAREETTVFLTTHNLHEAERLCARVAVIREGRLAASGRPEDLRPAGSRVVVEGRGFTGAVLSELRARPEVAELALEGNSLFLSLRSDHPAAPLVSLLVARGVEVEEVRREQASLEESFLMLMKDES